MTRDNFHAHPSFSGRRRTPVAVQILAIVGYTGFAIPVSLTAMDQFGFLGLVLTAFLAYVWTRLAGFGGEPSIDDVIDRLKPQGAEAAQSSGNTSFDAYRAELMARLETEQTNFEGFLTRLREAKDKTEFDSFMTDRERALREAHGSSPA